jgi:Mn2+/Fe2+ NRAMP family transporter
MHTLYTTALIPALVVTVTLQGNTTAADKMSQWLNVLQSVQLPFALIPLIHFCSRCVRGTAGCTMRYMFHLCYFSKTVNTL